MCSGKFCSCSCNRILLLTFLHSFSRFSLPFIFHLSHLLAGLPPSERWWSSTSVAAGSAWVSAVGVGSRVMGKGWDAVLEERLPNLSPFSRIPLGGARGSHRQSTFHTLSCQNWKIKNFGTFFKIDNSPLLPSL